jgi:hypothetical protein
MSVALCARRPRLDFRHVPLATISLGSKVDGFVDYVRYRSLTVRGAMRPDKD